jgi:signal transduction histidine kinase
MEQRAKSVGGQFEVSSKFSHGTTVRALIPANLQAREIRQTIFWDPSFVTKALAKS